MQYNAPRTRLLRSSLIIAPIISKQHIIYVPKFTSLHSKHQLTSSCRHKSKYILCSITHASPRLDRQCRNQIAKGKLVLFWKLEAIRSTGLFSGPAHLHVWWSNGSNDSTTLFCWSFSSCAHLVIIHDGAAIFKSGGHFQHLLDICWTSAGRTLNARAVMTIQDCKRETDMH